MGINWKKVGQFVVDVGIDSLNSSNKQCTSAYKKALKDPKLSEEQRAQIEEHLDSCNELQYKLDNVKYRYHSDYKDKY